MAAAVYFFSVNKIHHLKHTYKATDTQTINRNMLVQFLDIFFLLPKYFGYLKNNAHDSTLLYDWITFHCINSQLFVGYYILDIEKLKHINEENVQNSCREYDR